MSIFKSLPVSSQFISFAQMLAGDLDGARETQENFTKRCPVVSQVRSAIQAASGDLEGARATQEEFSVTCPVVSQVRSLVEAAAGDPDQAYKTQEKFLQALLFEERKTVSVDSINNSHYYGSFSPASGGSKGSRGSTSGETNGNDSSRSSNSGSSDTSDKNVATPEVEAKISKDKETWEDASLCCVCLEHKKNVCFQPCHHVCCCELHASQVTACPLCRTEISGRFTVYI